MEINREVFKNTSKCSIIIVSITVADNLESFQVRKLIIIIDKRQDRENTLMT